MRQTPAVHISGLEYQPFWDEQPHLATVLEENYRDVRWAMDFISFSSAPRRDLEEMLTGTWGSQLPAYPTPG